MNSNTEQRVKLIKGAIDELHGDTSETKEGTLEALEEISSHIEPMVEALEGEIGE